MRKILVTSALPYANGSIHLGHLVEYIQTDIWVRFQKMQGNLTYYICADDTHGTPIMLMAEKENVTPEKLVENIQTVYDLVMKVRPASVKGQYLEKMSVSSTMGPGIQIDHASIR